MIGGLVSADFSVFAVHPAEKFEEMVMENQKGQRVSSGVAGNQKVLCSTHLGLTKRMQLESGREEMSTVIRAKVVLESFLSS